MSFIDIQNVSKFVNTTDFVKQMKTLNIEDMTVDEEFVKQNLQKQLKTCMCYNLSYISETIV